MTRITDLLDDSLQQDSLLQFELIRNCPVNKFKSRPVYESDLKL